jgi:hypothetical protein
MTSKYTQASLVGGLIVFVWGMLSWMVIPWHQHCLKTFTHESAVAEAIRQNAPQSGIYVLPNTCGYSEGTSHSNMSEGMKMMEEGPFMFASIRTHGVGKMSPKPFIISLIIQVIGALIATWMLAQTTGLTFKRQVGFFAFFGLAVGILGLLPAWNWWGFSTCYVLVGIVETVIGWSLAGLAVAKLLKLK